MYDRWAQERRRKNADPVYVQMLEENRAVHRLAMAYQKDLGLVGRIIRIDGKIKAYTFGYPLNIEIFCDLFEIADLKIKGLPTFAFREFCWDAEAAQYKFINVMDDFALPNVERTKLSFKPVAMLPVYTITKMV